jgi:hypothetical protein
VTISSSSPIWALVRSPKSPLGLTADQVRRIVRFVNRSPTFSARMREFEAANGQLTYSDDGTNCFWITDKRIYISREQFLNSTSRANDADIETLTEVLAHEMSHFVTYFKEGLDLASATSSDEAGAAGVRDEARAYAHEYLIQLEINKTAGDKVDWMKEGQLEAIEAHAGAITPGADLLDIHAAATMALLDWAANWTGPVEGAGGYFQFYRNYWRENVAGEPKQDIDPNSVKLTTDSEGNISHVKYGLSGTLIATSLAGREADDRIG